MHRTPKIQALAIVVCGWVLLLFGCGRRPQPSQTEQQQTTQTQPAPAPNAPKTVEQPATTTSTGAREENEPIRRALTGTDEKVTIPAGTVIKVRVNELLGSDVSRAGESFDGDVATPIKVHGTVAIPSGTAATGTVVAADSAGHLRGRSELELRLTGLRYNDHNYDVHSRAWVRLGTPRGKRSVEVIGGGAGVGALIGAIVGGGKGAAIGAATGAGAGTATQVLTKPGQVRVPPETVVPFVLTQAIEVQASAARLR